jgi:hypothetical protein
LEDLIAGRLADVVWWSSSTAVGLRGVHTLPFTIDFLDAMPATWRRGEQDRVDYVVVKKSDMKVDEQAVGSGREHPTRTVRRTRRRIRDRRQPEDDHDSDSDDEIEDALADAGVTLTDRPFTIPSATPSVRLITGEPDTTKD